jgi:3-phosphoshikimate 1-carboxyvinyltransferase
MDVERNTLSDITIKKAGKLQGSLHLPGDKSISHRAALISLLCSEKLQLQNYSDGIDCRRSLDAVRMLGCNVEINGNNVDITPPQMGIMPPNGPIDCGNSGTTMRLLAGLLAGSNITVRLVGDESLLRRPMKRISDPLKMMNAEVLTGEEGTAPLEINPGRLIPIDYTLPIASAQVKSAILLAALAAGSAAKVREKRLTRDHTERMIKWLGGEINIQDVTLTIIPDPDDPRKKKKMLTTDEYKRTITLTPSGRLRGGTIEIPGDISTAAFFIAAALIIPGSHLILKNVGLNPTRNAFITVVKQMGGDITIKNRKEVCGEPVGDVEVKSSKLKPRKISGDIVPNLIDEIPVLAVLAGTMKGTTVVRDVSELRHKESDRIFSIVQNLSAMGAKVGEFPDGFAVEGSGELGGTEIKTYDDHRIAMAFAIAGLAAHGQTIIKNGDVADISCPSFFTMLEGLRVR